MRDTCVIGRPLSLAQALICACAALRSFFDVPVALIGTPESRRQSSTSPDSTRASQPRKRSGYGRLKPPSREPRLANTSKRPTWSSAGQLAKNLPKLPCSAATSLTNLALSRTDLIFRGLRTMRVSEVSFSQNSAGWNKSRLGSNSRNASSKPGHFLSMTLHTKPAEETRHAISDSTRSSPSLASALLLGRLGKMLASTFSPPLRLAARSPIRLNGTFATLFAIVRLLQPAVEEGEHARLEQAVRDHREGVAARDGHRLGAGDRVGQALRRPRPLVARAGDYQRRPADRQQRVAGKGPARPARAGGSRQPVLLLLVGEVPEAFQHRIAHLVRPG